MQGFELKDLLQALGPTASLIFAAWIFLSFLQSRYSAAYERYRSLLDEFRQHSNRDRRRESLHEQILEYKRRCEQMRRATNLGVIAAICLIAVQLIIDSDVSDVTELQEGARDRGRVGAQANARRTS
jgi:hypothetical protein